MSGVRTARDEYRVRVRHSLNFEHTSEACRVREAVVLDGGGGGWATLLNHATMCIVCRGCAQLFKLYASYLRVR